MNPLVQFLKTQPRLAAISAVVIAAGLVAVGRGMTRSQAPTPADRLRYAPATVSVDPKVNQMMAEYAAAASAQAANVAALPTEARPMTGTLTYTYEYKDSRTTEKREGSSKFELTSQMGGLSASGLGTMTVELTADSINLPCPGVGGHRVAKGDAKVEGGGGIAPYGGVLELRFGGELPVIDTSLVPDANKCATQIKHYTYYYGHTCRFEKIDLVHGGSYTDTRPDGGGGTNTCIIEISPK